MLKIRLKFRITNVYYIKCFPWLKKIQNAEKFIFLMLAFFIQSITTLHAQQEDLFMAELNRMATIPNSPEAEAFAKYGDTEVSLYTGTPNINIPLYTISGREFNLPINLTYDGSAIKVNQMATWVGLGWNLNAGGRVTRIANGLPDDYIQGDYTTTLSPGIRNQMIGYINEHTTFASSVDVTNYFEFLSQVSKNFIDTQPDYFMISAPGLNATVVFDNNEAGTNNEAKALNNPRIKVEPVLSGGTTPNITSWKVTGEDGTVYHFNIQETTTRQGDDSAPQGQGGILIEYASSWVLTKIESPNKKDEFNFNYVDFGNLTDEYPGHTATMAINTVFPSTTYYPNPDIENNFLPNYKIKQKFLTSIIHNSKTIVSTQFGTRFDQSINSSLARIDIFDRDTNPLKIIEFDYTYFNLDGTPLGQKPINEVRLKLDNIFIKGKDNSAHQTYSFEYIDPDDVPIRNSKDQDYLGYYNGANNNDLYPYVAIDGNIYEGANRLSNSSHAQKGMLNKITYPTGGYTEFEYESNTIFGEQDKIVEVVDLSVSLNGNSNTDPNLYKDDNGNYCDDEYLDANYPKIKIGGFPITEERLYNLKFTSFPSNSQLYLIYGPTQNDLAGLDNFCDFYTYGTVNMLVHDTNSFDIDLQLGVGSYKYLILLDENSDDGNQYGTVRFDITHEETTLFSNNSDVAGVRLKQSTDYDAPGQVALIKSYDYTNELNQSTAVMNYNPDLSYYTSTATDDNNTVVKLYRLAALPAVGTQPFITYKSVREYIEDGNGNSNGYVSYQFFNEKKGATPRNSPPYENNYYASLKAGQPQGKKVYHQNGDSLLIETQDYFEASTFSIQGMVATVNPNTADTKLMLKDNGNGTYGYDHYPYPTGCPSGMCSVGDLCTNPANYGYMACVIDDYRDLSFRYSYAAGFTGGLSVTFTKQYFYDSGVQKELNTMVQQSYDPVVDYLLRERTLIKDENDTLTTRYFYPKDEIVTTAIPLMNKNRFNEVVKDQVFRNEEKLSDKENHYISSGNYILPDKISNSKGDDALEDRALFTYYPNGNLKTAQRPDGPTTVYIWGFDDLYPVARLENTLYSDIENLSAFGPNFDLGENGLSPTQDQQLRGLPNAMVTIYTYAPSIGLTSIKDPRGYITNYIYDQYNRLKEVRDEFNNIVEDYKYHYKGQ